VAETKKTAKATAEQSVTYENNPFFLALNGLNFVFEKARNVAILLIIISIIGLFLGLPSPKDSGQDLHMINTPEQWALFTIIVFVFVTASVFIGAMLSGISAYTSAKLVHGRKVELNEAFHAVLDRFFSYIWLQIIILVKVLLWSLLFIIPGIIMAVRYSLANVAFFDKNLQGNAAIKESIELTRGAWLTTFAGQALFNFITLGVISELVVAGSRALLYRQLTPLVGKPKPSAHFLSWFTLCLPFIILALFIMVMVTIAVIVVLAGAALK
jgi:hypothetical protein